MPELQYGVCELSTLIGYELVHRKTIITALKTSNVTIQGQPDQGKISEKKGQQRRFFHHFFIFETNAFVGWLALGYDVGRFNTVCTSLYLF